MHGPKLQSSGDSNGTSSEAEIHSATFMAEVDSLRLALRGRKLTIAIAFVTGTGFTLFGCEGFHFQSPNFQLWLSSYDQGVMSSLLTAKQARGIPYQLWVWSADQNGLLVRQDIPWGSRWQRSQKSCDPTKSPGRDLCWTRFAYSGKWTTLLTFLLPQEIGCLIGALSNLWIGDRLGRRRTIVLGGVIMIIGAILQAASFSYSQTLVARVITGFGNGLNVWLIFYWEG